MKKLIQLDEIDPSIRTLSITRTFRASKERIFEAWTNPEIMKAWYCPDYFTVKSFDSNFNIGGTWEAIIESVNGLIFKIYGDYKEIVQNDLLIFTQIYKHPDPDIKPEVNTLLTVKFHSQEENLTKVEFTQELIEVRNLELAKNEDCWLQSFIKLDRYIENQ